MADAESHTFHDHTKSITRFIDIQNKLIIRENASRFPMGPQRPIAKERSD